MSETGSPNGNGYQGRSSARPLAIDLFAGAGGLSLGFEQAGFDIAAAVELDPIHAATHQLNFPYSSTICRDVRELSGEEVRRLAGVGEREVAVVFGGPPCQGFSLIGHRVLEDSRNELVFHFMRLVAELEPKLFVMENVPGMATGRQTQVLDELIDGSQKAGYVVRLPYSVLNAGHYGVPQDRRRLFILGARKGLTLPDYPTPTSRLRGRSDAGSSDVLDLPGCPSVADAIGDLPNIEEFEELLTSDELQEVELGEGSAYAKVLRGETDEPTNYAHMRQHDNTRLTGCLRAKHTDLSRKRFAATEPGKTEPVSRFYKLAWDGVCNTLRAGTGSDRGAFSAPRPIHPAYARCISVREAARLHSYPDWFRFHRTIWHGFRQIGNSVPPLLARAVAASLMTAISVEPVRPERAIDMGPYRLAEFQMREAAAYFGVPYDVIPQRKRRERAEV